MKKIFYTIIFSLFFSNLIFSQDSISLETLIPETIRGLWEADDRYIYFEEPDSICIILKEYYSWYLDRVVEPENYSEILKRTRNLATQEKPLIYTCAFIPYEGISNAWELTFFEEGKIIQIIPVAHNNDELYLNFLVKIQREEQENETKEIYGYWQGINSSKSIRISPRNNVENIYSWFITEDGIYKLRFWQTNMSFDTEATAEFTDGDNIFSVNKHIKSANQIYTCASGRSSRIRNVEKFYTFNKNYKVDENYSLMFIEEPYLRKKEEVKNIQDLMEIVKLQNSKRKPAPEPLFPVKLPKIPPFKLKGF